MSERSLEHVHQPVLAPKIRKEPGTTRNRIEQHEVVPMATTSNGLTHELDLQVRRTPAVPQPQSKLESCSERCFLNLDIQVGHRQQQPDRLRLHLAVQVKALQSLLHASLRSAGRGVMNHRRPIA